MSSAGKKKLHVRRLGLLTPFLAVLLVTLSAAPLGTASAAPFPGGRSETSVVFRGGSARVVGSSALVPIRCLGSERSLCNGTLTLSLSGHRHKVPFSLVGGSIQSVAVPVGRRGLHQGATAIALARTVQPTGSSNRTYGVLRLH